jgi:Tfp pilus assembly protein PilZ
MDRKDSRKFIIKDQPVIVDCHNIEGRFQGTLQNISSSGVFINTDKFIPVGQEVAMILTLPGSNKTVKATGEIVRSTDLGIAVEIKVIFKE